MSIKTMEIDVTPENLEMQENLSLFRLKQLDCDDEREIEATDLLPCASRPQSSFIDLMDWTVANFSSSLKDRVGLNKFVHNRIIIDGQFLHYCELTNITVTTLFKDSIVSWETDHGAEKFFTQGVFRISKPGLEFLSAALFHKGNQNEDEISFFIICSEKNYENYIKFRNEFDEWVVQRDRSNLHIRVIDGEDIPYNRDHTWDDMFLPENIKSEIESLVENFLSSQKFYTDNKIPWKRGFLLYGEPGNGKTSIIRTIISNYNFKPVTIVAGATDDSVREAFSYAEEQSPSLLYFEDLDSLLEKNVDASSFLNLMDGKIGRAHV